MLITESQINISKSPLTLLDKMNYLTEAESVYAPAMVPIVENTDVQANLIRLEDMIAFGESNGIEDLGYALTQVCEASEVDPSTIAFTVQDTSLIENEEMAQLAAEIMNEGCPIIGVYISDNHPATILAEAAIEYAVVAESDALFEAFVNDDFDSFAEAEGEDAEGEQPGRVKRAITAIKGKATSAKNWIAEKIAALRKKDAEVAQQEKQAAPEQKSRFKRIREKIAEKIQALKAKFKKSEPAQA